MAGQIKFSSNNNFNTALDPLIDSFFDNVGGNEACDYIDNVFFKGIWQSFSYGLKYQPSWDYFAGSDKWYNPYDCKQYKCTKAAPKGYKLWTCFFSDISGYYVYTYYPIKPKKGEKIRVLYDGGLTGYIEWYHKLEDLFYCKVRVLMALDFASDLTGIEAKWIRSQIETMDIKSRKYGKVYSR